MNHDRPREECGIIGIFGHPEAAKLCYLGLYALQHRGQEGAGIVSTDGNSLHVHRGLGLVHDVFTESTLNGLKGSVAIGHVRYSTTGSNTMGNVQPLVANYHSGSMAIAHNGNLTNAAELRRDLEREGAIFQHSSDSEVVLHLAARSREAKFEDALKASLAQLEGAYSMLLLHEGRIFGAKDPRGIRPLCIGTLGDATIIASESCALDIMDAQYVKEVRAGEMVVIEKEGIRIEPPEKQVDERFCVFEYIYFSRPDSIQGNKSVSSVRNRLGRQLAREYPVEADIVIAIPDSSNSAALGYSEECGLPFKLGLIRNHYVGRTFIEPEDSIRHFGARIKFNASRSVVHDRRVIVVDDSIVRGTTGKKIAAMLRRAGAREVHLRVSAPPWKHPCYYGIDTPTEKELIGNQMTVEEIGRSMGVDSIGFLSIEGLLKSVPNHLTYCTACFTGEYDAGKPKGFVKSQHEEGKAALV